MRKLPEPLRHTAAVLQDDAAIRREPRHIRQIAVAQACRFEIGAQQQPVPDRNRSLFAQSDVEAAGAAWVDPSLGAVSFPHHEQPILAPNNGHGGVFREWTQRPVETQHVPWLVVLHAATFFPRPF